MLKRNNTWKAIAIGFVIGSTIMGAGFSTFYVLSKHYQNEAPEKAKKHNYNFIRTALFKDGPTISEANITNHEQQYWLGKAGLEKLKNKIVKDLTYGPEMFKLKSIVIGNENFITEESNGVYIPATNEIFINTKNYLNWFPTDFRLDDDALTNIKVEILFQVIFHEYYHHLAHSYLINAPLKSTSSSKEIYSNKSQEDEKTEKRSMDPWNKDFIANFKKNLRYDTNTKKVKGDFIHPPNSDSNNWNFRKKKYKSIGSIYNQKDLFEIANGKTKSNFSKLKKLDFFDGYALGYKNPYYKIDGYIFGYKNPYYKIGAEGKNLKYYYSISELFVRKYQQLIQPYFYDKKYFKKKAHGIMRTTKNNFGAMIFQSNLLYNRNHYESLSWNNNVFTFQRYLQDAPFSEDGTKNKRSIALFNNLDKHFGHSSGDDVSFLWSKNDSKVISNKRTFINTKDMAKKIKFGGYIKNKNEDYKYVGYKDEDGKFVGFPIDIHDFTYRSKKTLESSEYEPLDIKKENKFYVLRDWINISDIKDKPLLFSKTKTGTKYVSKINGEIIVTDSTIPLVSARNSDENGYASTWSRAINDYSPYTTYAARKINGKIMIGKKTW